MKRKENKPLQSSRKWENLSKFLTRIAIHWCNFVLKLLAGIISAGLIMIILTVLGEIARSILYLTRPQIV